VSGRRMNGAVPEVGVMKLVVAGVIQQAAYARVLVVIGIVI